MSTYLNRAQRRRRRQSGQGNGKGRIVAICTTLALLAIVGIIVTFNARSVPRGATDAPMFVHLAVGQVAPPFSVTTIDGSRISLASLSGPVMLEVFATWCPHCQRETQVINALHKELGNRLSIVAVSGSATGIDENSPSSIGDVREFAAYFHVTYPIAYDGSLSVAKSYLQGGYPTIVFINGTKRITSIRSGEISLVQLLAAAQKAR
jgi:thiol-disulfide isomerase/thioredoxin